MFDHSSKPYVLGAVGNRDIMGGIRVGYVLIGHRVTTSRSRNPST